MMLTQAETGLNYTKLKSKTNITSHTDKRLSVQISLYGLSFLVTSLYSKKIEYFSQVYFDSAQTPEELLRHISDALQEKKELSIKFEKITLIYQTNAYTLVPSPLFNENKASEYLKFTVKILATDYIAYDEVKNSQITVVYIPFININNYFFENYGTFKYYHSSTLLLEELIQVEKFSNSTHAYINVEKNFFDILVFKKGQLVLCNTFEYHTPEDFIYYILFVFEQLKLDPNATPCILLGELSEKDELYNIAYTYIKNISFYKTISKNKTLSDNSLPHQHLVLKNSY